MSRMLDYRLARKLRQSSASSASQEVIIADPGEYEDTGARDTAQAWQWMQGNVRPQAAGGVSFSTLDVIKDSVIVLRNIIYAINAGSVNLPPWYALRSSLASSAIEIRHAAEVRAYLDQHPDMYGVMEEICKGARQEFGPEAFITLQVYRDPEIDDEYLLLRVRLRSYGPDMTQRIRSVSAPYESDLYDKSGSVIVTTDFRPIR